MANLFDRRFNCLGIRARLIQMIMMVMMQKSRGILTSITFLALTASIGGCAATNVGGITMVRRPHACYDEHRFAAGKECRTASSAV